MKTKLLFAAAALLGALAVLWMGGGFVGANPLALLVTVVIGFVYALGLFELVQFRNATSTLATALEKVSASDEFSLQTWLATLHPSLQNAVGQRIEGEKTYEPYTLPEPFTFTLNLDDLPWDVEDRLFDRELFDENLSVSDEGVEIGNEEEKKLPPPQVLIMSSGEITPFTLSFNYEGDDGDNPVYYSLQNQDLPPLVLEGPLERPL